MLSGKDAKNTYIFVKFKNKLKNILARAYKYMQGNFKAKQKNDNKPKSSSAVYL